MQSFGPEPHGLATVALATEPSPFTVRIAVAVPVWPCAQARTALLKGLIVD